MGRSYKKAIGQIDKLKDFSDRFNSDE